MKNCILSLILVVILCVSCQERKKVFKNLEYDGEIIRLNNQKKGSDVGLSDDFIEIIGYVVPELTDSTIIKDYDKIDVVGDSIFILSSNAIEQAIYCFDFKGKCLFKIDRQGKGAEEYFSIDDFFVNKDLKHIGILYRSSIYKYDFSGKFIGKTILENNKKNVLEVELLHDKLYCYQAPLSKDRDDFSYVISVYDLSGKLLYEDYPVNNSILNYEYRKQNHIAKNSNNIYINELNNDTIYTVQANRIVPRFIIDLGEQQFPQNDFINEVVAKNNFIETLEKYKHNNYSIFGADRLIVTNDFLYLFFPTFDGDSFFLLHDIAQNQTHFYSGWKTSNDILFSSGIKQANDDMFYCVIPNSLATIYREMDISDKMDKTHIFSIERMRRFETLYDYKDDDNSIIVLLRLKQI